MAKYWFCKSISLLLLVLFLAGCQFGLPNQVSSRAIETSIGALIQDELILTGWNYLNQMDDEIVLWDGRSVTGRDLAGYVLQHGIPVVWGSNEICGGGSCSRLYCTSNISCTFEDGNPGVDPIYINRNIQIQTIGQVARLAAELAHEIFHRQEPFGPVIDTQFEEYWAFYITAQVSKATWPNFQGYDPMDKDQLKEWLTIHTLQGYLKLAAYPQDLQPTSVETGENQSSSSHPAKDLMVQ